MRAKIDAALKEAILARDKVRVSTLRLISAAMKDREIALRTEEGGGLRNEDVIALLARMVKQREDSATTYEEVGRMELAEQERAEQAIIREFLPKQLGDAEIDAAIQKAIETTGATSLRDMGKVMAALKADYVGQMDFGAVGGRVRKILA